ncbi:AraC family transcriptional regulator [Galbibacter pacificus]|uniref:AraC family transcriptional regulator n=1 Tax=Galbibacter pacificus TaxID=2996052 RepID=A0ABT6FNA6_9FLAO|nr:AraC family transcriptional regulator [Galbibacter pacificus]MDG3581093.1 AraC family transcriptional regulator [Galbibacter pacificus]MDG3584571.1 AraC family transcriptional regulator [Galbibacter pacificus]
MTKNEKIHDGFIGQRMIVLPKKITNNIKKNPLIKTLYFTDIGFFPNASNHFLQRAKGSKQYILIYCRDGQGFVHINKKKISLSPNTYYIIPPDIPHKYYASTVHPWSIYWLHFTGNTAGFLYQKFLESGKNKANSIILEERRISLFDNLIDVLEDGFSIQNIEYTNISLWQLLNSFLYEEFFIGVGKRFSENNTIQASIEYMKANIESPLKVSDIAKQHNYSPSHYFSLFKKETGYSPIHYFNQLKVQKACQYLSFSSLSIKEICFSLGFSDPLYFSRLFKKTMNMSPLKYRKDYQH